MAETIHLVPRGAGPRRTKTARPEPPRRTTFHEDDMHVATIVEHVHDGPEAKCQAFCSWYTAGDAGQAHDYDAAYGHIVSALQR